MLARPDRPLRLPARRNPAPHHGGPDGPGRAGREVLPERSSARTGSSSRSRTTASRPGAGERGADRHGPAAVDPARGEQRLPLPVGAKTCAPTTSCSAFRPAKPSTTRSGSSFAPTSCTSSRPPRWRRTSRTLRRPSRRRRRSPALHSRIRLQDLSFPPLRHPRQSRAPTSSSSKNPARASIASWCASVPNPQDRTRRCTGRGWTMKSA